MSLDVDQEILEDFLVEAGEILEQLSEQLVDLEQRPDDRDLLNAIFRGFHTVKGGAGFLQLDAMVECCHKAENLFDLLRNGELSVSSELMDVVLQALDAINAMFESVRAGQEPEHASANLLQALVTFAEGGAPAPVASAPAPAPARPAPVAPQPAAEPLAPNPNTPMDDFESLLGDLAGSHSEVPASSGADAGSGDDLITEDEFEALLDELHGPGKGPSVADADGPANVEVSTSGDDLISDDEFEALLDDLQSSGQGAFAHLQHPPAEAPKPAVAAVKAEPRMSAPAVVAAPPMVEEPVEIKETKAKPSANKPAAESNVRVDTRLLDKIMNMVGELVLVRNRLVRLGGTREDEEMAKALGTLDMVTADLQTSVMKTRMQPVKKVFGRFPRLIRDLSRNLKKEVRLELRGEETDLDKNLVEALADPLIHLVRNAVDHGIEAPDKRAAIGKPREGHVLLSAEQEGDHILLIIQDDGAGMDPEILRNLAVKRGMMDAEAARRLTDQECFNLIFQAGFSTKTEVSDVSGRGVGMDVVKTKITQLNGTLSIDSILGQGTRIAIQVPLTLAIMPTLMVMLEGQAFALPLVNVNEIFNLDLTKTNIVDGQQVIIVRDQALPLFHLKRWLVQGQAGAELPDQGHVVIVSVGTTRVGFVVDQLVGQEEVVIKPLGSILHGTPGLSGATITGDGRIALIIDIPNLLKYYAST
ncbi:chemotaxis protein CheA [Marinobacterium sediminicola]|uniref:histidine kinase n=1 Tax=Marinobacterium sediminicola TaxID=518898 RepID=A0ABY1RYC4_9GAMM|nr:chemotaxis protein CheW [Marinobacterium sediminicola]ULG68752.1 chemotaxis protein CheA [Marinobacterium sediminicola]SMR73281.1 two-component system, chemotaxis family, sensor kinase CheA [Marinobacterium sediminicola]